MSVKAKNLYLHKNIQSDILYIIGIEIKSIINSFIAV